MVAEGYWSAAGIGVAYVVVSSLFVTVSTSLHEAHKIRALIQ